MEGSLINLVPEQLFILVASLYVLGICFKKIQTVKDKYIPMILVVFAVVFSCWIDKTISALPILQGIMCWGVSVGVNQFGKQLSKEE